MPLLPGSISYADRISIEDAYAAGKPVVVGPPAEPGTWIIAGTWLVWMWGVISQNARTAPHNYGWYLLGSIVFMGAAANNFLSSRVLRYAATVAVGLVWGTFLGGRISPTVPFEGFVVELFLAEFATLLAFSVLALRYYSADGKSIYSSKSSDAPTMADVRTRGFRLYFRDRPIALILAVLTCAMVVVHVFKPVPFWFG